MGSKEEKQEELFYASEQAEAPGHPFYQKLNTMLSGTKFDAFCEEQCRRFYHAKLGRPSMSPGVYFRLLLIGFFEGIASERGICWRVADSLSLRRFLNYGLGEATPDHVTMSRTRRLLDEATHQAIFTFVLTEVARRVLKAAFKWPSSRFVKIWNSFAGVAPFHDLKRVKTFTSRDTAVQRIWEAIARLEPMVTPAKQSAVRSKGKHANDSRSEAPAKRRPPMSATAQPKRKHASAQPALDGPANKKAQVIAMLRHAKGVTLTGIMETTGWQKHTVRGFISILGRKGGMKIESSKNAAGHRFYHMAR